jgi:hypothetical protein
VGTNFQIGVSDRAKMSQQYNTLVLASDDLKKEYELKQKEHILEAARLEREILTQDWQLLMIDAMFRIVSAIYLWRTTAPDVVQEDIHRIIKHIINMDRTFYRGIFNNHDNLVTVYHRIFPDLLGILSSKLQ